MKDKLFLIKRRIKFIFQKWFRGFSDDETWSLSDTIAKFILPRLKRFKQVTCGYPEPLTEKEWDDILDKMIHSFEFLAGDHYSNDNEDDWVKVDEGLELFSKYYNNLWW